jgi:hypothetical protein
VNVAPIVRSAALVVVRSAPEIDDDDGDVNLAACRLCRGPVRLCGGPRCTGGPSSPLEVDWLAAIRGVYVGIALVRTEAALWGGALLRWARRLAAHAVVTGGPASPAILRLAGLHADPAGGMSDAAAGLALAYLQRGDLDALSALCSLGGEGAADWLVDVLLVVPRAARTTPLERDRYALFAVRCDGCARDSAGDGLAFECVNTYDAAIRCPSCRRVHVHPLPGMQRIGAPHPVGRCLGSGGGSAGACITHEGLELDVWGLCGEGRATMERAVLEADRIGRPVTAHDRELFAALARARDVMPAPIVAAVAALDPEAAEALKDMPGMGAIFDVAGEFMASLGEAFASAGNALRGKPKGKALPELPAPPKRRGKRTPMRARRSQGDQ